MVQHFLHQKLYLDYEMDLEDDPWGPHLVVIVCTRCSALVFDPDFHHGWHEELDRIQNTVDRLPLE